MADPVRIWLVALWRSAVTMSPFWGSFLLNCLGYRAAATIVLCVGGGWWARIVWDDFRRFRRDYLMGRSRQ